MKGNYIKFALGFACSMLLFTAAAQIQLVKDINTSSTITGSWPYGFTNVNGTIFFTANDGSNGSELWKTDGTTNGTVLVKDIAPGSASSSPNRFVNVNGTLFFTADDGISGIELWKSDGTSSGTVMVEDIYPGSTMSNPYSQAVMNSILYFIANDGTNGVELWRSDGTAAGTDIVKDINPGIGTGAVNSVTTMGSELFFLANDGTNGYEFWKSDGTALGTNMVKDINPGAPGSTPTNFTVMNGFLYFQADDGVSGIELWKSNGTTGGTSLLKDINGGGPSSNPKNFLTMSSTLLFFLATTVAEGEELWKTDGTALGTVLVQDINPGGPSSGISNTMVKAGTQVYFQADDGTNGIELWASDGTTTSLVKDIFPGSTSSGPLYITEKNGSTVYFNADDGPNGKELWRSDGTPGGTVLLKDIYAGINSGNPGEIVNINGTLYFLATTAANSAELWISDGTAIGTVLLKNIAPDIGASLPSDFTQVLNTLYFSANDSTYGIELWKSDGTPGGTVMVKDIYLNLNSSYASAGINFKDTLYFVAMDGGSSVLWKSDGTAVGTVKVKPSGGYSYFSNTAVRLTSSGNNIFFCGNDAPNSQELWKTDGTSAGTQLVRNICNSPGCGSKPNSFTDVNGIVFFAADDGMNGNELWKSDGTFGGTQMVRDICPGGGCDGFVYPAPAGIMVNMGGTLIFRGYNGSGYELWKSDGTSGGTVMITDIYSGGNSSYPSELTNVSGTIFFSADDPANGRELWKTDGTAIGTVLVKDIFAGTAGSAPTGLRNINGKLYFSAANAAGDNELWMSDGTLAGTVRVKDINPGTGGSYPAGLAQSGTMAFFSANDGNSGTEIWVSNGTAAQTALAGNIYPGAGSSSPANLTPVNSTLFFSANDGTTGTELWKLNIPPSLTTTAVITPVSCYGYSNGAINITVSGGTSPYSFSWSNGATTEDVSGLSAGTFSVVITDSWGWTLSDIFNISQPAALTLSVTAQTNVTCNAGNNGSAAVTVSGGTPAYAYLWSNTATTAQISGLTAQVYSVTATDANNCTQTLSVNIMQPTAVVVALSKNESPCGEPNSIASVISGGTPGYNYLWSTGSTNDSLLNMPQSSYSLTVTDAANCTGTNSIQMNTLLWQPIPICMITVDSMTSTRNEILWEKPITVGIDSFRIYRNILAVMTWIASVSYDSLSVYIDTTNGVNPKQQAYEYALSVRDTCGNESTLSTTHTTIHQITPQFTPPNLFDLQWSDYLGYSIIDYEIWRDSIHNNDWQKIGSVLFSLSNSFTDLNAPNDSCRYRIEAVHPAGCILSVNLPNTEASTVKSTKSNTSEKVIGPTGVPATSTPDGIGIYPNPSAYRFTIQNSGPATYTFDLYNLLGEKVYGTRFLHGRSSTSVDVSSLPPGIYQLKLSSGSGVVNRKVVISR